MRKFSFQQKVLSSFVAVLFFGVVLAITSTMSIRTLKKDAQWVSHTQTVLYQTNHILFLLKDSEANARGYMVSGLPSYLEYYRQSAGKIEPSMQELRHLVEDNPQQAARVDTLILSISLKLSEIERVIEVLNAKGSDAAAVAMKNNATKLDDKINALIVNMKAEEDALLMKREEKSDHSIDRTLFIILAGSLIILFIVLLLLLYIIRTFKQQKITEEKLKISNLELDEISKESAQQNWVLEGAVVVDVAMRGAQTLDVRCLSLITEVSKYVKADLGAVYVADPTGEFLHIEASYAFPKENSKNVLKSKVGLIGQAVAQKKGKTFNDIPGNYIKVSSGLGDALPQTIFIQPVFVQDQLVAVIELAFFSSITLNTDLLFDKVAYSIGISIQAAQARVAMQDLVARTQQQAKELESQQEELRTTNEELIHKTHELQASEEELRVQQEELRQINSELEEKAELLEEQNMVIGQAHEAIALKAGEIERTSKYKSEFLANMSHELRTPLNSILILARILKENKNSNLSDEQVKYANVIHNAGNDLLTMINDILDLAKIESGKVDLNIENVSVDEIKVDMELLFSEVANSKHIDFFFNIADGVPASILSDRLRLEQILKNLLSNAFKFTPERGTVSVGVVVAKPDHQFSNENLLGAKENPVLSFIVKDTGIGIASDKINTIFEAFQQEDGSTSRKYGGTGLGLSISRELANILGGEIDVESKVGEGSSFILYLPVSYNKQTIKAETFSAPPVENTRTVFDNVKLHSDKENILLIIEDDINFAEVLKDYALERGFKPMLAHQGDTGLDMAFEHLPNAIILDIMLPVMDGWTVLKRLKENPATRDIPVHLMSAGDERQIKARKEGAIGFMKKPVDKDKLDEAFDLLINTGQSKLNKVLIIEDHEIQSEDLSNELIKNNVVVRQSFDGAQALDILRKEKDFDCIILDLHLPDISGLDLLDKIKSDVNISDIPVVINTAMELGQDSMERIMKHTHAMVLKSKRSNDRLIDEVNLFMDKIKADKAKPSSPLMPGNKAKGIVLPEKILQNKSVLIVDDDMRNIFALTSALQVHNLQIQIANNGIEALKKLDEYPKTDIVLMDIMMPEMDGYETMREIRKQIRFNKLPVIALTAKAMKDDRDKCVEAGASDYITKPVDIDKLLSLIRVWLS